MAELKEPRFQEYHLFFTNEISNKLIDKLAESDPSDKIKNIQEVYLDYYAVGRNIFSLNIPSTISLSKRQDQWV
jgi:vacuolar protein sorting-associated protein 45